MLVVTMEMANAMNIVENILWVLYYLVSTSGGDKYTVYTVKEYMTANTSCDIGSFIYCKYKLL